MSNRLFRLPAILVLFVVVFAYLCVWVSGFVCVVCGIVLCVFVVCWFVGVFACVIVGVCVVCVFVCLRVSLFCLCDCG